MYKQFPSLADAFLNYFDVDLATTARQLDDVARIRYRVYCEEFGFEPAGSFPHHRESDVYDAYSLQCMVTHRRSHRRAGCVRLVCAAEDQSLPLEDHCRESLYLDHLGILADARERSGEISRLAVDAAFRKRPGEGHSRVGEFDAMDCCQQEQRSFSLIGIAALLSAFALASLTGREQLFGMMEPNLPRLLRRSGILVQEAGDPTEYHGQRAAYFITTDLAVQNMREDLRELYESIYKRLAVAYRSVSSVA